MNPEYFYSENISEQTQQRNSYCGESAHSGDSKITEDSYCEHLRQRSTHGDFQCKSIAEKEPPTECYFENITEKTVPVSSVCVNETQKTATEDFYSDSASHTQSEDSYFEIGSKHALSEELNTVKSDFYCENVMQLQDSYDEEPRHQPQPEEKCSENPTQLTLPGDSYSESQIQHEDSCSGNPAQLTLPDTDKHEDSYSEDSTKREDLYSCSCENQIHEDSYSEKQTEDSYCEKHAEDSYSEKQPGDSYSEKQTADSYSEKQPEDSYSEKQTEDSYSEKQPEDSYSEKQTEDSYSKKQTEDSYSEKETEDSSSEKQTEDSYSEKQTADSYSEKQTEDSYSEKSTEDSYSEKQPEDSYSEKQTADSYSEKQPEDSYCEKQPEDSYCKKQTEDSYCEKQPEYSYCEKETEDSYSEKQTEDSYSESPAHNENSYFEKHAESYEKLGDSYCEGPGPLPVWQEGQKNQEEEEQLCDRIGGRRSGYHQTEVSRCERHPAQLHMSTGSGPKEPERVAPTQSSQSKFQSVSSRSGAVCSPGTRDRGGRASLTITTSNPVWLNPACDGAESLRLSLYYTSTLRAESQAMGSTVLVDARRAAPGPALFSALRTSQEDSPGAIHSVLLSANKDSSQRVDRAAAAAAAQVEVSSSSKSSQRHVELQQLPAEFGGSFSFSQSSWIVFRSRVELLTKQCRNVIDSSQETISNSQSSPLPAAAEEAESSSSTNRAVMCSTSKDVRLVQSQQEGGASSAWLRREEASRASEERRAEVEAVASLYDQVDESSHRSVTSSNSKTQQLSFIMEFSSSENGFSQVRAWSDQVGEVRSKVSNQPADSLELVSRKQQDFLEFYTTAYDRCKRAEVSSSRSERWDDVSSPDLHAYEVKVHSFWARSQDFSQRVKGTGQNIERAVQLYRFLDQAYGWALEGMRQLARIPMEDCTSPDKCNDVIGRSEDYRSTHPPIPESRFQEMKAEAGESRGERGLRQWSFAWSKCQETNKMFDRKMEAALRTRDSAHRCRSDSVISTSSTSSRRSGSWGIWETSSCSPPTPQRTPFLRRLLRSSSSYEESEQQSSPAPSLSSSPSFSSSSSRRQQSRKTQSFDCPPTPDVSRGGACPRTLSEPPRRGNTGVFIRGSEVSSSEAADRTSVPRTPVQGWVGPRSPGSPGAPAADDRPRGSKLRHIVEEMVTTEREYVRSLRYIIHHYFPEMERADVPQDSRGKRSVIFGNSEKSSDFHSQFFSKESEACWKHPSRVPHCFSRHQEQFSLYALYSKNKPKSDALLANHGHAFFRRKQSESGDKMDSSSYSSKPIQRMSKYASLLSDLIKEVGVAQEAELTASQEATKMVKFQLRHGNDSSAMDAIRDCDVNSKEQGQSIRQDEFTVWSGRRKCQRHIFSFEDSVSFSKPKKMEAGSDVFIYKHSFKTADVGSTESSGDNGLRFEIWFRRRTAKNQTFMSQAATPDVKHAWTADIARLSWTQAARNKEMRSKEMVSMGVGSKPYSDIQPSDAAISDRAVHRIMKARGARTRASIAVSTFDHAHPFSRGAPRDAAAASGPSSCGSSGPLNSHMLSHASPSAPPADASFASSCIEEDEQEHDTCSQPSMTTESSGSSSHCLSGSTGSDSGCVSSHLQEASQEEPRPHQPSSSGRNGDFLSPEAATVV